MLLIFSPDLSPCFRRTFRASFLSPPRVCLSLPFAEPFARLFFGLPGACGTRPPSYTPAHQDSITSSVGFVNLGAMFFILSGLTAVTRLRPPPPITIIGVTRGLFFVLPSGVRSGIRSRVRSGVRSGVRSRIRSSLRSRVRSGVRRGGSAVGLVIPP